MPGTSSRGNNAGPLFMLALVLGVPYVALNLGEAITLLEAALEREPESVAIIGDSRAIFDLDLVAVLDRRFGPAAFRQHVVIHGDGEMVAFILQLAEQRVDAI